MIIISRLLGGKDCPYPKDYIFHSNELSYIRVGSSSFIVPNSSLAFMRGEGFNIKSKLMTKKARTSYYLLTHHNKDSYKNYDFTKYYLYVEEDVLARHDVIVNKLREYGLL